MPQGYEDWKLKTTNEPHQLVGSEPYKKDTEERRINQRKLTVEETRISCEGYLRDTSKTNIAFANTLKHIQHLNTLNLHL